MFRKAEAIGKILDLNTLFNKPVWGETAKYKMWHTAADGGWE